MLIDENENDEISSFSSINIVILFEFAKEDI